MTEEDPNRKNSEGEPQEATSLSQEKEDKDESHELIKRLQEEVPDISELPQEKRDKIEHVISSCTVMKSHSGPLPPPEDIAAYNKHIPQGADRIMTLTEKQSDHRRDMEDTIVKNELVQNKRGQIFGLIIGIFGIAVGAVVTLQGHDAVGGGIAGTTVISLVYAFITGQRSQRSSEEKQ